MKSILTFNTLKIREEEPKYPKLISQHIAESSTRRVYWYRVRRSRNPRERWFIALYPMVKSEVFRKRAICRNMLSIAKKLGLKVRAYHEK